MMHKRARRNRYIANLEMALHTDAHIGIYGTRTGQQHSAKSTWPK
jgi:hypothetical protein